MPNEKKCPVTASKAQFGLNLLMIALGAVGLSFLSIWVSAAYIVLFFVFFFVIMPFKACQYCYFRVDSPLEEWKEEYLQSHAESMKRWGSGIFLIWIIPIVGIIISFFLNFSIVAAVCLVGFIAILYVSSAHLSRTICAHCAILEICPLKKPREH